GRVRGMAEDAGSAGPWLVVGLGNPGPQYAGNRHNIGAIVVAQLAADLGVKLSAHRSRAQVAEARLAPSGGRPGERVVLAVPTSCSGTSREASARSCRSSSRTPSTPWMPRFGTDGSERRKGSTGRGSHVRCDGKGRGGLALRTLSDISR